MWSLTRIYHEYNWVMKDATDPRTSGWLLMTSPWPTVSLVILYLILVIQGQRWMRDRKALEIKNGLMVYNFCLVLLNAYIFYEFLMTSWLNPAFNKGCQTMDYSTNELPLRLAKVCWWYYFSKIIEFMDTFFFVLRKKNQQISFLHVYHHSTMPLLWWIGVKFVPGGESYLSGSINSFIHILMYTYYFLAAMGPHMQKFLWWKRYMTALQLIQFWWIFGHALYSLYLSCGYPNGYNVALICYVMSHILLFSNFYYRTYTKKAQSGKVKARKDGAPDRVIKGAHNGVSNGNINSKHDEN
ncbi:elongation of very long chain fatty acids protein 4-like [Mizuhopecten yessoensis]|uniref:elongation of very long chain fatty acids protein 4-like n=1 Tax=Mizuhopecten yessoensis TaxID=6573 RepID=UPI000B45F2BB|nr:elongation of very long chain fatty acids protein 4-like [Mizuhopecten yessoensis]